LNKNRGSPRFFCARIARVACETATTARRA